VGDERVQVPESGHGGIHCIAAPRLFDKSGESSMDSSGDVRRAPSLWVVYGQQVFVRQDSGVVGWAFIGGNVWTYSG